MSRATERLLNLVLIAACMGAGSSTEPDLANQGRNAVKSVTVSPDTMALALGEIGRATCAPKGLHDAPLTTVCSWRVVDTTIAKATSGSQASSITARKVGRTLVIA